MTDFFGYSTRSVSSPHFRIDMLENAGPRIVRLVPAGTQVNLLAEIPNVHWPSPGGEFYPLGGHRLWAGPESPELTYMPDHLNAILEEVPNGYCVRHEDHFNGYHYQRQIEVSLDQSAPKATLIHELKNLGTAPLRVLPWAVTQFRMGGKAHLPLNKAPADAHALLPNRNVVLWPYTDLHESRLHLNNESIEIDAIPREDPLKVGVFNAEGWAAIEFEEGWVVIKRFAPSLPEEYADFNTNLQCYVRDVFIELETLGKLSTLQPGQTVTHVEKWEVQKGSLASLGLG